VSQLRSDTGKSEIWFIKPLRFGGSISPENTIRVDRGMHIKLVAFWNKVFLEAKKKKQG